MAKKVDQGQVDAKWKAFATNEENQRLAALEARMGRRNQSLAEDQAERQKIMRRCIKRLRRQEGKDL